MLAIGYFIVQYEKNYFLKGLCDMKNSGDLRDLRLAKSKLT